MSRLVFTEKSEEFFNNLLSEEQSEAKTLEASAQLSLLKESTKKIASVLNYQTPTDEYQKKILDLANISKDSEAMQLYLVPKALTKELPPYMKKKIDHITKIITNTRKENESKATNFNSNETNNSSLSFKKPISLTNENNNLLQMRCNTLLYSENYLERLLQRYKKYLEKNNNINLQLNNQYFTHRKVVQDEKINKDDEIIKIENEKSDLLNFKTKYNIRFQSRIGDYHKKRYIKIWEKNNLPPIGLKDNVETLRKFQQERKSRVQTLNN